MNKNCTDTHCGLVRRGFVTRDYAHQIVNANDELEHNSHMCSPPVRIWRKLATTI